jgi:hypothetical protein
MIAGTLRRSGRFHSMRMRYLFPVTGLFMLASAAAGAQAPQSPASPPPPTALPAQNNASATCPPAGPKARDGAGSSQDQANGSHEELGDKLAKSNGVICPPKNIDPEIRAPTPNTGKMPVIPPPGSPGGNPNVQPK